MKTRRGTFLFAGAALLLLCAPFFFFLPGCGPSYGTLTQAAARAEQASIDAYFYDRGDGSAFRGNFYDSAAAWNAVDSTQTKYIAEDLAAMRPEDSLGEHSADYYGFERAVLDARFIQIISVAKP